MATYGLSPGLLARSTNCLAAEVHQSDATSTDVSFDLELTFPAGIWVRSHDLVGESQRQIPRAAVVTTARLRLAVGEGGPAELQLARVPDEQRQPELTQELRRVDTVGLVTFDVKQTVQGWCDGD